MNKKKKIALVSTTILGVGTLGLALGLDTKPFTAIHSESCDHFGYHYEEVLPSFATAGNKEFYCCCKCHETFLEEPLNGKFISGGQYVGFLEDSIAFLPTLDLEFPIFNSKDLVDFTNNKYGYENASLRADIELSDVILTIDEGVLKSLDLNGFNITATNSSSTTSSLFNVKGELSIVNSDVEKTSSVTYNPTNPDLNVVPGYSSSLFIVNGNLNLSGNVSYENVGLGRACYVIDHYDGEINISDGSFSSEKSGIRSYLQSNGKDLSLNVFDGNFFAKDGYAIYTQIGNSNSSLNMNFFGGTALSTRSTDPLAFYAYTGVENPNVTINMDGTTFESLVGFGSKLNSDQYIISSGRYNDVVSYNDNASQFIEGGLFATMPDAQYLVNGFGVTDSGDTDYPYLVGPDYYEIDNQDELLAYFESNSLFGKLTSDVTLEDVKLVIDSDDKKYLDLNGFDIIATSSSTSYFSLFDVFGNLVITNDNSDEESNVTFTPTNPDTKLSPGYASEIFRVNGELTCTGMVNYENKGEGRACYSIDHFNGELNIEDGTFTTVYNCVRSYLQQSGKELTSNISGGTFYAKSGYTYITQIENAESSLDVTISGGVFDTDRADYPLCLYGYASKANEKVLFTICGGEFKKDVGFDDTLTSQNIEIFDGQFGNLVTYDTDIEGGLVYGGQFKELDSVFVAEGYKIVESGDPTYVYEVVLDEE